MRHDEKKIREAIEAVVMEGVETPTNDQVRSKLKGGSFSVITPVLKSWREEKSRARIAALSMPEAVKERIEIALAQIWHVANEMSGEQLVATRDLHLKEKSDWDVMYRDLEQENKDLVKEVGYLKSRVSELRSDMQILNSGLAEKSDELSRLLARNISLQAELAKVPLNSVAQVVGGQSVPEPEHAPTPKIILL